MVPDAHDDKATEAVIAVNDKHEDEVKTRLGELGYKLRDGRISETPVNASLD